MTTDITELAQSLKAAAVRVIKNYDSEWFEAGHQICTVHKSKINLISLANPVNVLALVEALEKAQGMEAYWKTQCRGITDHCEVLQARIAELEEAEQKLCAANVTLDARAEFAEHQLAGLESRLDSADKLQDSAFRSGLQHGFSLGQTDDQKGYEQSMAAYSLAAGIKVEAE